MATHPQLQKLAIHRNQSGRTRKDWFDWLERELGRRIESNRELSTDQASHLLTALAAGVKVEAGERGTA